MRIVLYLYSATGNTRRLARAFRERLAAAGHEVTEVDMLRHPDGGAPPPADFDRAAFAFPVMVFRVPYAVDRFLKALPAAPRQIPAGLLLGSGGMGARTDARFAELAEAKNLRLVASKDLYCADSYLPFRKWLRFFIRKREGYPNEETIALAEKFADDFIAAPPEGRFKAKKGLLRSLLDGVGRKAPPDAAKAFLGPRRLDRALCTGCGLCAGQCPARAIRMEEGYPIVSETACVGCCACFNICPEKAWRLDRFDTSYYYIYREKE